MSRGLDHLAPFAAALLDVQRPLPPGLRTWNGSDPAVRFAVYRNNVVVSLISALAATFPVTRARMGEACFAGMAHAFIVSAPPRSPVLDHYGAAFPAFIAACAPAAARPELADLARLELLRLQAYQAADAVPLAAAAIAPRLAEPARLPAARLRLVPSLAVLMSAYGVVSLWAAEQGAAEQGATGQGAADQAAGRDEDAHLAHPESALILRAHADVLVIPVGAAAAAFTAALQAGQSLAQATTIAQAHGSDFDLAACLAMLIRHGAIAAWHQPGDPSS